MTTRQWITLAFNLVVGIAFVLYNGFGSDMGIRGILIQALAYSIFFSVVLFAAFKILRWNASWLAALIAAIVVTFAYSFVMIGLMHAPELQAKLSAGFILGDKERPIKAGLAAVNFVLIYWATRERRTNR